MIGHTTLGGKPEAAPVTTNPVLPGRSFEESAARGPKRFTRKTIGRSGPGHHRPAVADAESKHGSAKTTWLS